MKIPIKNYFHLFLIISEFFLATMLLTIFAFGVKLNKEKGKLERVWICSKIIAVDNMLNENINLQPIESITYNQNNGIKIKSKLNKTYKTYLLDFSGKNDCDAKFKKCGILDTYGNYMCIPEDEPCPINEIILESKNNESYKNNKKYNSLDYSIKDNLYYTNNSFDNNIIVYLNNKKNYTYFINEYNFKVDEDIYNEYFEDKADLTIEPFGHNKSVEYIQKKINDDKNKDKYVKNISDIFFIKNYIGFKSYEDLNLLISQKEYLLKLNQIEFPNITATVFAMISFVSLLFLIIFSLTQFFNVEKRSYINKKTDEIINISIVIGIYFTILIGYTVYLIYICYKINRNNKCTDLKKIGADDNIKYHIKEACKIIIDTNCLLISGFALFALSIIFFIISWYTEHLYEFYLKMKGRKLELQFRYLEKKYKLSY